MDGNGRWAGKRGLPRLEGHRAGVERIRVLLETLASFGVRFATIYAFSTENWGRPQDEVEGLMSIFSEAVEVQTRQLHERNVRIVHLGKTGNLDPELRRAVEKAQALTCDNTGITLNVAFDYGGRDEILGAVRRIIRDGLDPEQVDEGNFPPLPVHRPLSRSRPDNTDGGRAAHQQLPAVAVGLQRVLSHLHPLARPSARRTARSTGSLPHPAAALRQGSRT